MTDQTQTTVRQAPTSERCDEAIRIAEARITMLSCNANARSQRDVDALRRAVALRNSRAESMWAHGCARRIEADLAN